MLTSSGTIRRWTSKCPSYNFWIQHNTTLLFFSEIRHGLLLHIIQTDLLNPKCYNGYVSYNVYIWWQLCGENILILVSVFAVYICWHYMKSICNKMSNIENILTLPSINQCFLFRFTEHAYIKRDSFKQIYLSRSAIMDTLTTMSIYEDSPVGKIYWY
jgi:hypothetical protein